MSSHITNKIVPFKDFVMTPQVLNSEKFFWVVVADESIAIVYARDTRSGPLRKVFSLDNEAARMKTERLISDSGGRSFDSKGKGRHTMTSEKADPKMHAASMFAKQIAKRIGKVMNDGSCRGFALVAAPRFLGVLRDAVSVATSVEPYATVDKEVVGRDTTVIERLLTSK
jgi:protein required for attachment to host cells